MLPDIDLNDEIPQEVKDAAIFLGNYFKKQGIDNWALYDVFSQNDCLDAYKRGYIDKEILLISELHIEVETLKQKIQKLIEAGDAMAIYAELGGIPLQFVGVVNAWREAKEDNP